jgi:hypothetical protein
MKLLHAGTVDTGLCVAVRTCGDCVERVIHKTPSGVLVNSVAASQEITLIVWNRKVHCRIHKSPPLFPILGHFNPVDAPPFHFLTHFNILPSTPICVFQVVSFPKVSPPVSYIHRPLTCYMPFSPHSWFERPCSIWGGVHIIKLLIMQCSQLPRYLVSPRPKYSPQHHILKHTQTSFLLQWGDHVPHP